jgi:hypothetical protein
MSRETAARQTIVKPLARAISIYSHLAQRQPEGELRRGAARHIRNIAATGIYDSATLTVCGLSYLRAHDRLRVRPLAAMGKGK